MKTRTNIYTDLNSKNFLWNIKQKFTHHEEKQKAIKIN